MPIVNLYNRVKIKDVSLSGFGNLDPSSGTAPNGFLTIGGFDADIQAIDQNLVPLSIVNTSNGEWELGLYKWDATAQKFLRNTNASIVLQSSNGDDWVPFTGGADKEVLVVAPAGCGIPTAAYAFDRDIYVERISPFVVEGISDFPSIQYTPFFVKVAGSAISSERRNFSERLVMQHSTFGATPTEMLSLSMGSEATLSVRYRAIARITSGSAPYATKVVEGHIVVADDGSADGVVGSPSQTVVAEDAGLSTATVNVGDLSSGAGVTISVTGVASTNITWLLEVDVLSLRTSD